MPLKWYRCISIELISLTICGAFQTIVSRQPIVFRNFFCIESVRWIGFSSPRHSTSPKELLSSLATRKMRHCQLLSSTIVACAIPNGEEGRGKKASAWTANRWFVVRTIEPLVSQYVSVVLSDAKSHFLHRYVMGNQNLIMCIEAHYLPTRRRLMFHISSAHSAEEEKKKIFSGGGKGNERWKKNGGNSLHIRSNKNTIPTIEEQNVEKRNEQMTHRHEWRREGVDGDGERQNARREKSKRKTYF